MGLLAGLMTLGLVQTALAGPNSVCLAMRQSYGKCVKNYGTHSNNPAHDCRTWLAQMKAGHCL